MTDKMPGKEWQILNSEQRVTRIKVMFIVRRDQVTRNKRHELGKWSASVPAR